MAGPSASAATEGGHGSTASAGHGPSNPAYYAMFAARQKVSEQVMRYYAAGICGLIAVFVLFHWTRLLVVRLERSKKPLGMFSRPFVATSRLARNLLVRKVPGFSSAGHAILVTAYIGLNLMAMLLNVETNSMSNFAARFGWMALVNLSFLVFLALKNTPLAFLTAYSYERLNCLHQIAGYTMFAQLVLHGALYTAFFNSQGRLLTKYADPGEIAAIIAGFAFLSVVFAAAILRRFWYELFYVTHITCWIVGIVATGFHQPEFTKPAYMITLLAASMWVTDRIIRMSRVLYNSVNNEATLHPLPNGGTKIVLKKVPARAEPGKHCFIWLPAIRKLETHPFTIHRGSPVEFTVKAQNGFTRDLHNYAVANPGASVRASVDGPYGTFPDPMEFDKIVLIAGGGGATFTFGLAVNVLERMTEETHKNIVFIWAVQKHENLSWFKEQLDLLRTHAHSTKVNVSLYVTRAPSSNPDLPSNDQLLLQSRSSDSDNDIASSPPLSPIDTDTEKNEPRIPAATHARDGDPEKEIHVEHHSSIPAMTTSAHHRFQHPIKEGRPDAASLIRDAVNSTPASQRVLVAACGPQGLMRVVRDTTARLIQGGGPGVELHCEQFGW
ncbi:putative ferric reductase transmembrane component [Triangularia verruculosa]|uniref:ferric-chelate reductase (NADPH) n=1 Tax=Triangularia verruculosa TaxID=2587418 RepID=A0AAN7APQ0_9PEZI|nr:putative ferric reductase transmembrane component [Triangularia verruculosa]